MRLVADSGLWSTGPLVAATPLVAVLEVSGAVLSWTVDDAAGAAEITFTDVSRADWLWRVVGEPGHAALAAAIGGRQPDGPEAIQLAGVDLVPGSVDRLRRLAVGHWLRRWWPASRRDGIAGLDHALLDAEVAALTVVAQDFFTDDTLDSEVGELLAPHAAALTAHARDGDPRVVQLVGACAELADEVQMPAVLDVSAGSSRRRDDYALAAGPDTGGSSSVPIAAGVDSIRWGGVPPEIFDAAEDTVDWSIEVMDSVLVARVRAATIGPQPATGIPVRLVSGAVSGANVLDPRGRATLTLFDSGQRMTEIAAWQHDWASTSVVVGADANEAPETRERIRRFARARLARPDSDAFLAEILAAESDY
jgi:hypothetical protein